MSDNSSLTQAEISALEATASEAEWNAVCDRVKEARDGRYPADWFPRVNMSGLMARAAKRWSES